jgi:hypothetical protein
LSQGRQCQLVRTFGIEREERRTDGPRVHRQSQRQVYNCSTL